MGLRRKWDSISANSEEDENGIISGLRRETVATATKKHKEELSWQKL